jgi:hypothetical protein
MDRSSGSILLMAGLGLFAVGAGCLDRCAKVGQEADEVARGRRLDAELVAVRRCIETKRQIAVAVVAGEVSLAEAANLYRALNEATAPSPLPVPMHPDTSEEERLYRQVIRYIEGALEDRLAEGDAFFARLEGEMPTPDGPRSGWKFDCVLHEDRSKRKRKAPRREPLPRRARSPGAWPQAARRFT